MLQGLKLIHILYIYIGIHIYFVHIQAYTHVCSIVIICSLQIYYMQLYISFGEEVS